MIVLAKSSVVNIVPHFSACPSKLWFTALDLPNKFYNKDGQGSHCFLFVRFIFDANSMKHLWT
jgi:hypothetical protein